MHLFTDQRLDASALITETQRVEALGATIRTENGPSARASDGHDSTLSDAATEELLLALQTTRTDLAKLVRRVHQRDLDIVVVPAKAIARWQIDAVGAWECVQDWLRTRGVRVTLC